MKQTIRDTLLARMDSFTPSEHKVAQGLLDKYPSLGLSSISNFANHVGVSDPTVFRFVVKLGYSGYAAFQQTLLTEIDAAMNTPLARIGAFHAEPSAESHPGHILLQMAKATEDTTARLDAGDFRRAVDLLSDEHSRVFCGGGRYTAFLAMVLAYSMSYVRPHVRHIDPALSHASETLVDMGPTDVLVVFDFRRYQRSVIEYAYAAQRLGVRILLITDEWKSPIADFADTTLMVYAQPFSVIDTKVPALALCEALVITLTNRAPEKAKQRVAHMQRIDAQTIAAGHGLLPQASSMDAFYSSDSGQDLV